VEELGQVTEEEEAKAQAERKQEDGGN